MPSFDWKGFNLFFPSPTALMVVLFLPFASWVQPMRRGRPSLPPLTSPTHWHRVCSPFENTVDLGLCNVNHLVSSVIPSTFLGIFKHSALWNQVKKKSFEFSIQFTFCLKMLWHPRTITRLDAWVLNISSCVRKSRARDLILIWAV